MATGKVNRVIDGDTFELAGGQSVRLAGVDAPELGTNRGSAARRALQGLLHQGDTVGLATQARDHYGRLVAQVSRGGKSVNESMRRKGYK